MGPGLPSPYGGLTGRREGGTWVSIDSKGQEQSHPGAQQSWGPVGLASSPTPAFWDHLSWPWFPHLQHKT